MLIHVFIALSSNEGKAQAYVFMRIRSHMRGLSKLRVLA